MNATAVNTKMEQELEFKRFLDNVLNERYTAKITVNDDDLIDFARINTMEILDKSQMALIMEVADAYRHDFQLQRSGHGIKITFTLIEE